MERRFLDGNFELRNIDDEEKPTVISGTGAVFNKLSAPLLRAKIGKKIIEVREKIDPHAFDEVMKSNPDVVGLFNHDPNIVLGRTVNKTMEIRVGENGVDYDITPPDTQYVRDIVLAPMIRGDVLQSSFGFKIDQVGKGESFEEKDGVVVRTILKIAELRDMSPVTFPAYPETKSLVRSLGLVYDDFSENLEESLEMSSEEVKEFRTLQEKYKRLLEAHEAMKRLHNL